MEEKRISFAVLDRLPRFSGEVDEGYKPGLERMRDLLAAMGDPHRAFPSIHVAGTNGKGSVASMTASIASGVAQRVGLHTTPHLQSVTELMRVNGTPAPDAWLEAALRRYEDAIDRVQPSYFEATVALSFRYFAEQEVDLAVVEVGLGGRLDATNVLQPEACVITSIDLEHTAILGDTLAAVAREKAGIIKSGTPVVTGVTQDEALHVIREVADERGAPLHTLAGEADWRVHDAGLLGTQMDLKTPSRRYDVLHVALPGRHQQTNAVLAVRAAELALPGVTAEAVREGLRDVRRRVGLRGRLDVVQEAPWVLTDVAHNPSSLGATLSVVVPNVGGRLTVGLALAKDKDWASIAQILAVHADAVVPVQVDGGRLHAADVLAEKLSGVGVAVTAPTSVPDAMDAFRRDAEPDDALLLTGSHTVVAAVEDARGDVGGPA